MEFLELIDNMDLPELLDFIGFRNSYKEMINSADDLVTEAELKSDFEREEKQIKFLEEKEKEKNGN